MKPNHLPRYRTIKECIAELKKIDSDTAISEFYIRRLCKSGEIKYLPTGNKSLVNLDNLLEFLGYKQQPLIATEENTIVDKTCEEANSILSTGTVAKEKNYDMRKS